MCRCKIHFFNSSFPHRGLSTAYNRCHGVIWQTSKFPAVLPIDYELAGPAKRVQSKERRGIILTRKQMTLNTMVFSLEAEHTGCMAVLGDYAHKQSHTHSVSDSLLRRMYTVLYTHTIRSYNTLIQYAHTIRSFKKNSTHLT
jgi:hypothetical protein